MVNKIWAFFIIIGIIFSVITGKVEIINNEILDSTKTSFDMIIKIFPVMALWLGIMNIAVKSGLIEKLSKLLYPILRIIFPEIPKNHESFSYISASIVANMLGLGNASTPLGLKAMKSMKDLNDRSDASNSMITFLVITTSGVTIIPTTVIALRKMYGSINPTNIIIPCIIVTFTSLIIGLIIDRIIRRNR